MSQYNQSITKIASIFEFQTEVDKLLTQRSVQAVDSGNNFAEYVQTLPTKPTDSTYSAILLDYGNGRITSGLNALELISILCSGTAPANLFLFDNVIYTGSVSQFKSGTTEQLIKLVTDNLGMTIVLASLPQSGQVLKFKAQCLNIANDVKLGKFFADTVRRNMLIESKKLVKNYLGNVNG